MSKPKIHLSLFFPAALLASCTPLAPPTTSLQEILEDKSYSLLCSNSGIDGETIIRTTSLRSPASLNKSNNKYTSIISMQVIHPRLGPILKARITGTQSLEENKENFKSRFELKEIKVTHAASSVFGETPEELEDEARNAAKEEASFDFKIIDENRFTYFNRDSTTICQRIPHISLDLHTLTTDSEIFKILD
ncbi:MAG: hypothetical protein Q4B94_00790 [Pseudomonadota bacterium]|nr:hypothetical protein [Pseudomonadota bacterium]